MKKYVRLLPIALLTLAGCSNEEIENVLPQSLRKSVTATIENGKMDTRTAIQYDSETGKGTILWSTGDAFKIFSTDATKTDVYTLTEGAGTTSATFSVTEDNVPDTDTYTYAAYPASYASLSGTSLTMTLPATITYTDDNTSVLPMWANASDGKYANVSFKHLGAAIKLDVKNIPATATELKITADKPISGTFTATLGDGAVLASTSESDADKVLTITFTGISGNKSFYVPIPAQTYGSLKLELKVGNEYKTLTTWTDNTLERAKIYDGTASYKVINADTPSGVSQILDDINIEKGQTVDVVIPNTIVSSSEDYEIVVPSVNGATINLSFSETPTTTETALFIVTENADTTPVGDATETLNVSVPADAEANVIINAPTTTVSIEGSYKAVTTRTATNTLIIKAETTIEKLIVSGGNVEIGNGAVVSTLERDESNADALTSVSLKDGHQLGNADELWKDTKFSLSNAIPAKELNALKAFYTSTNGDSWTNHTNWNTDASVSEWYGILSVKSGHVIKLRFEDNNLNGVISPELEKLEYIESISFYKNYNLRGTIPPELGNLLHLKHLGINFTNVGGSIPTELGNLSNLTELALNYSQFEGNIPAELGNLTQLMSLYLQDNKLDGSIPTELTKLEILWNFDLSRNQLSGAIPQELGNMKALHNLLLSGNKLEGEIPSTLSKLQLYTLYLSDNNLTGNIPEIFADADFRELRVSNNKMSGIISKKIQNASWWETSNYATYILPQQEGYGFILEEVTPTSSSNNEEFKGENVTWDN